MTTVIPEAEELRRRLAEDLSHRGALTTPQWFDAFASVPREVFVPEFTKRGPDGVPVLHRQSDPGWLEAVYTDQSLITRYDAAGIAVSSSSQPFLMARMLEALGLGDGQRVLEIGIGTGYNCALLAHRLGSGNVVSIDIDATLAAAARERMERTPYRPLLVTGNGLEGHTAGAPYDALLATCGVDRIPAAWREQVRPGGVIVANLGLGIVRLVVEADGGARGAFLPDVASFMTARTSCDVVSDPAARHAGELLQAEGRSRPITPTVDPTAEEAAWLGALAQPGVGTVTFTPDGGTPVWCLRDTATGSWARVTTGPGTAKTLTWDGPRDLWAEREPLLTYWAAAGRPGREEHELHITPDGAHVLRHGRTALPLDG